MQKSKVDICNIALALLGLESIRSFDENNIRSRLCDINFDVARDYLLARHDWRFARRFNFLEALDMTGKDYPVGVYAYGIPSDCITPRDIHPRGSRIPWSVQGQEIWCFIPPETEINVGLYYTGQAHDTFQFTDEFINFLAYDIAIRICLPLTGDKELKKSIAEVHRIMQFDSTESDANVGEEYKNPDDRPDLDTFVNTDPGWSFEY